MSTLERHGAPRPTVTVVVAAYEEAAVLGDCVRSLLALNYPRDCLQVVVVDNGSRDGTARVAQAFGPAVTVLHEAKRGAAAARNRGIAAATGDVIAFTDADCVVDPGWLSPLVAALADPAVGVAGGRIAALRPCTRMAELGEVLHDHASAMSSQPPYAITMSWASSRAVLEHVGAFDESLLRCQDIDLAYRIVQAGHHLAYVDDSRVYHRNRSTLRALLNEAYLHGRGSVAVRRIHAGYLARFPARPGYVPRIVRQVRNLRKTPDRRLALFRLVFDLGKIAGELRGEIR
jgi:glycosyltransferase involved in cell wall biosynthesis